MWYTEVHSQHRQQHFLARLHGAYRACLDCWQICWSHSGLGLRGKPTKADEGGYDWGASRQCSSCGMRQHIRLPD
jgi:hypothetical protein